MAQNSNNLIEFIEGMIDIKLYNSQNKKKMGLGTNSNKVVKTKYREFNCRAIPKCGRYFYKPNKEFNINILVCDNGYK